MRRIACLALLPLLACGNAAAAGRGVPIAAQGTGNVRSYAASGFDAVALEGGDDVEVRVGGGFSVRAEGDPGLLDKLDISREGNALIVSRKWSWAPGRTRVVVTMPSIVRAAVGGSGNLTIDRVRGAALEAKVGGSGNIAIRQIAAPSLDVAIGGSGNVAAQGDVGRLAVRIGGSGRFTAPQLIARSGELRIAGSGDVTAQVRGNADVRVAGSGDVDLGPAARCTVKKTGSGRVRCGG